MVYQSLHADAYLEGDVAAALRRYEIRARGEDPPRP